MGGSVIHWFRKGLRLHDNPALVAAIHSNLELYPVFILDPWFVKNAKVGQNRWRFLQQSLADLDSQLRDLGTRLFVLRGSPETTFKDIFTKWDVKKLTYEVDTEPYAKLRDEKISKLAKCDNVEVISMVSHTLYDLKDVIQQNKGSTPLTYQKFQSVIAKLGQPQKATVSPEHLPESAKITNNDRLKDEFYNVPTLEELGLIETELEQCKFPGGETEGLNRLDKYICEENSRWVRAFEKPKTSPNSLSPSTTVLSPYLKFGCLSSRLFYEKVCDINRKGKHSEPPVSLVGQLLWREFFYTCGASVENFDKMKGNPICRQIPWDNNEEYLTAWKEGRTGYPFIDSIMTQLKKEGWIHHLARHSVACFLTRGDLWVSWEEGMKVFEEYLLDADWSLNAGNWMWLSASAFFHQYFRVYSPIAFGKKTDPSGSFIKKYLPKLEKFPEKYIYEPWTAPLVVQQKAGCIIGKDYPKPIVDHSIVSKLNMSRMKAVFDAAKGRKTEAEEDSGQPPKKKAKVESSKKNSKNAKITSFMKKK